MATKKKSKKKTNTANGNADFIRDQLKKGLRGTAEIKNAGKGVGRKVDESQIRKVKKVWLAETGAPSTRPQVIIPQDTLPPGDAVLRFQEAARKLGKDMATRALHALWPSLA